MRARPGLALMLVLTCLAGVGSCRSATFYDAYRAQHPDWEPVLPLLGASLPEVVAALHAGSDIEEIRVEARELRILRLADAGAEPVGVDELVAGAGDVGDADTYAVVVDRVCSASAGLRELERVRVAYYLLPENRLAGWDHYEFRSLCAPRNHFRAVGPELAVVERRLAAEVGAAFDPPALELAQVYRRGISYLEAGRPAEAAAMLVLGERNYRAALEELRRTRPVSAPDGLAETVRLRESLMRALGVEARQ